LILIKSLTKFLPPHYSTENDGQDGTKSDFDMLLTFCPAAAMLLFRIDDSSQLLRYYYNLSIILIYIALHLAVLVSYIYIAAIIQPFDIYLVCDIFITYILLLSITQYVRSCIIVS
jgi:hypothetical protein